MNTPAHLVLNALVLGRGRWRPHWLAITVGALLPDLPMFGFYFYERVVMANPEQLIWSQLYFKPHWQNLFDFFHSLPIIAVGAIIAWRFRMEAWLVFFLSMAMHCLADLPLHNEDAHRHFFPLSAWQFHSPISYWDPHRYGLLFVGLEVLLVVVGSIFLALGYQSRPWRMIGIITLAVYLGFAVFAFSVWAMQ